MYTLWCLAHDKENKFSTIFDIACKEFTRPRLLQLLAEGDLNTICISYNDCAFYICIKMISGYLKGQPIVWVINLIKDNYPINIQDLNSNIHRCEDENQILIDFSKFESVNIENMIGKFFSCLMNLDSTTSELFQDMLSGLY